MSLNLRELENNKNEILKAEIGALLFNLGKTHIGFWHIKDKKNYWRDYFGINNEESFKAQFKNNYGYDVFSGYKDYFTNSKKDSDNKTPFEIDIEKADRSGNLSKFFRAKARLFDDDGNIGDIEIMEILKGSKSSKKIGKQTFFRGCENINSGIDKGSPKDSNKLETLWLSNAFGAHKKDIKEDDFDKSRLCFFQRLHRFLEDNRYYKNPDWQDIRNWIFDEIKSWYSRLLSDFRFPINDVTLWEQAYMSGSMFKSALAAMFLDNSKVSTYLDNPQSIKWSILGVQYDKLSLAEKGLKAASIEWYRNTSNEVDDEIKSLIETDYALGNEVYRDETGIYFIVPENILGDKNADFYELHRDLEPLKKDIQKIFLDEFKYEVFPAIFLTEPSRGLMNLGHLLERAKEHYLKAEIPYNFETNIKDDKDPDGICQVCGIRLAHKEDDEENLICSVCRKRQEKRIVNWIEKIDKETIWTDELQDKNGRIALITLKFELEKWLNGDLVNSLLVQEEDFRKLLLEMKTTLLVIKELYIKNAFDIESYKDSDNNLNVNFLVEIEKLIYKVSNRSFNGEIGKLSLFVDTTHNKVQLKDKKGNSQNLKNLFNNDKFKIFIKLFDFKIFNQLSKDAYKGCKNNGETFDDYIRQIFFGSIVGNEWQELVKEHPLNSKILWQEEKIEWNKLTDSDIDFLSQILLQFLLRKNPSPARLKRIWDTTREFFEELESRIVELAEIKEERRKRLVWHDVTDKDGQPISDGEYEDGDIVFWAKGRNVYLITSIEKIEGKKSFKPKKVERNKRKNNDPPPNIYELHIKDTEEQSYSPYFTILDPTPISWQFIIPAENIPKLIKNIEKEYYKNFKWVYGKLPLHIGIVIQNYKRPLYIGIKALRNIRRDGIKWEDLREEIDTLALKSRLKIAFHYQASQEKKSDCENHYSLFEKITNNGKYEFYLYPKANGKYWIDTTQNSVDTERFYFYPNTLDFEFLDTNARRNDIFYKKNKRLSKWKRNRPYDLYDWQYFEKFNNYFSDKKSSSKLQKLISLIYSKLEDWKDNDDSIKLFMISSFVNVLELKKEENKDEFAKVLGVSKSSEFNKINAEEFRKRLYMLLDMFNFWHTGLKEV